MVSIHPVKIRLRPIKFKKTKDKLLYKVYFDTIINMKFKVNTEILNNPGIQAMDKFQQDVN